LKNIRKELLTVLKKKEGYLVYLAFSKTSFKLSSDPRHFSEKKSFVFRDFSYTDKLRFVINRGKKDKILI